ncbi:hypothetical protein ACE38W_01350 [Chitinophaga sp. Hz27]|uniref:hypothetical protein n=1 Tax=Chitinophaga sp. Hz27 TaxID=3347169 RepID=UPI0035DB5C27
MADNIVTAIIALIFLASVFIPLGKSLIYAFGPIRKLKARNKQGEIIELDLRKKNDATTLINFVDVYLGHK